MTRVRFELLVDKNPSSLRAGPNVGIGLDAHADFGGDLLAVDDAPADAVVREGLLRAVDP